LSTPGDARCRITATTSAFPGRTWRFFFGSLFFLANVKDERFASGSELPPFRAPPFQFLPCWFYLSAFASCSKGNISTFSCYPLCFSQRPLESTSFFPNLIKRVRLEFLNFPLMMVFPSVVPSTFLFGGPPPVNLIFVICYRGGLCLFCQPVRPPLSFFESVHGLCPAA